ncbi:MAG: DUF4921 family protein [bacterium]|nr:DUF4921 family protein [bacterium]
MKSQLRQDLVSGDWIVIAPNRGKRPHQLVKKPEIRKAAPVASCPFENPQKTGHQKPILLYGDAKNWQLQIIENKFPAFTHRKTCSFVTKQGPYSVAHTVGHHEMVITRNHNQSFDKLSSIEAHQVFEAFRDRYLMLLNDACISYVAIFHNWGPKAGASIFHPHYQIAAIPVLPPDVSRSLNGSWGYFQKNKKCVHCLMIAEELKNKSRIIYQNKGAVAFAPFVSKEPFEVRIFPKKHLPYFENTLDQELADVAMALQVVLRKVKRNLKDPDYNFFIHTAPILNKEKYKPYHWHVEVRPKIAIMAGFELGTGIEINAVDPDDAAKLLRK